MPDQIPEELKELLETDPEILKGRSKKFDGDPGVTEQEDILSYIKKFNAQMAEDKSKGFNTKEVNDDIAALVMGQHIIKPFKISSPDIVVILRDMKIEEANIARALSVVWANNKPEINADGTTHVDQARSAIYQAAISVVGVRGEGIDIIFPPFPAKPDMAWIAKDEIGRIQKEYNDSLDAAIDARRQWLISLPWPLLQRILKGVEELAKYILAIISIESLDGF